MTNDGGETWKKVLYIDAEHGCADMDIDVNNPKHCIRDDVKFLRRPWMFVVGSEKTGVFRSVDGGRTWTQLGTLANSGLPKNSDGSACA